MAQNNFPALGFTTKDVGHSVSDGHWATAGQVLVVVPLEVDRTGQVGADPRREILEAGMATSVGVRGAIETCVYLGSVMNVATEGTQEHHIIVGREQLLPCPALALHHFVVCGAELLHRTAQLVLG